MTQMTGENMIAKRRGMGIGGFDIDSMTAFAARRQAAKDATHENELRRRMVEHCLRQEDGEVLIDMLGLGGLRESA